jgi:hypothetical protein
MMVMATIHESAAVAEAIVPLAFPFTHDGYRHVLLGRVGRWCVVERTWIGDGRPHLPHFDVVHLRIVGARRWPDGRWTAAHEAYPPAGTWGREGWTEPTLIHVHRRWAQLRGTRQHLPTWDAFGLVEDLEGYRAWLAGHLPCREGSAPTRGILVAVPDRTLPPPDAEG